MQELPAPVPGWLGPGRADANAEVKARWWLVDVAVVCPATKSVVERQKSHVDPGLVAAKAGEAVRRRKYRGAVSAAVVHGCEFSVCRLFVLRTCSRT